MVEKAATPQVTPLRRRVLDATRALTTPLLPDDYLALINPLWSTRELTGDDRARAAGDAATPRRSSSARTSRGRATRPGQYLRIGVELNGIRHWRAYSHHLRPRPPRGPRSASPSSTSTTGGCRRSSRAQAQPGSIVFLGEVEGEFRLPDPLPEQARCSSAPAAASRRSGACCASSSAATRSTTSSTCTARATRRRGHLRRAPAPDGRRATRATACTSTSPSTAAVSPARPRRALPGLARARDVPLRPARA